MKPADSPLRLLAKSYSSGLLDRQQYLQVRLQLLKKLSSSGSVSSEDLRNFLKIHHNTEPHGTLGDYSIIDWVIIVLGLVAAAVLGIILYS